ncbi:hypothetical protein FRACYDRAFT_247463 [Fragilariopsis cylindrus CCMP1102]|uniref:Uncharacterized protein n=1 Tax=Fragilariopsis cylindrus CCMP1102 TaxID=635003 RepID=A0A1E7EX53_9STRA|nr:hypothetical protein FRACYDRAFT_247463 [Fragilariopsis cylindrus CCMP1102]|eukprot:OEU10394.1 hypothetical protein FRACYDRAFT_247463 [Fragilariopsis cylindrus CCMP1102]
MSAQYAYTSLKWHVTCTFNKLFLPLKSSANLQKLGMGSPNARNTLTLINNCEWHYKKHSDIAMDRVKSVMGKLLGVLQGMLIHILWNPLPFLRNLPASCNPHIKSTGEGV